MMTRYKYKECIIKMQRHLYLATRVQNKHVLPIYPSIHLSIYLSIYLSI